MVGAVLKRLGRPMPEGRLGVWVLGHRGAVGGKWEAMGRHQFEFMRAHGLEPSHCLLDIGCGSLRGGVHFIRYLDAGNYLGFDKQPALIRAGVERELGQLVREKRPQFSTNDVFDFSAFTKVPDFSIAQSLFSHLAADDASKCLRNLAHFVGECQHRLYATFLVGDSRHNRRPSHAHRRFFYEPTEFGAIGRAAGWKDNYIGLWTHPQGQHMMEFSRGPE